MLASCAQEITDFIDWPWCRLEPYYEELQRRPLSAYSLDGFLTDWSALAAALDETYCRLEIATTLDTTDEIAAGRFHTFLDTVHAPSRQAEQRLREKLLNSNLEPEGMEVPLQKMRVEAALFRAENVPLLSEEKRCTEEYLRVTGGQSVRWQGKDVSIPQLLEALRDPDRNVREAAWRLGARRERADRPRIDEIWKRLLDVRGHMAANAGYADYRSFRWDQLKRLHYSPADCQRFHQAILAVVAPVVGRLARARRQRLQLRTLRPWDLVVDPSGLPPPRPLRDVSELVERTSLVMHRVCPEFGRYYDTMKQEGLLDLAPREHKAQFSYVSALNGIRRPFIFMNAVGTQTDVFLLLHQVGHAVHGFESSCLPYLVQRDLDDIGLEFAEVAALATELLAGPHLTGAGIYREQDARRARAEQFESYIWRWCWIGAVDAFQHWAYEHPEAAADPDQCDGEYHRLMRLFFAEVDWSGLEEEQVTEWRYLSHIHLMPFYFVEYGLAQLGAVQIWAQARHDPRQAVESLRAALQLGGTRPTPELYAAAGAQFAFNADTLRAAVSLLEEAIQGLS